jgi:hypothetical protein
MFLPVKSHFLTTYHDSLLALLFSFFTLAHLSCFLYFSPSHIWSTNYSVLVLLLSAGQTRAKQDG